MLTGGAIGRAVGKIPVGKTTVASLVRTPISKISSSIAGRGAIPTARSLVPISETPQMLQQRFFPKPKVRPISATPTLREVVTGKPVPRIGLTAQRNIAQKAAEQAFKNPGSKLVQDNSKRVFQRIAEELGAGNIQPKDLPQILKDYGMSSKEFAQLYVDTISTSGKELNILSQFARQVKKVFPEAAPELSKMKVRPVSGWEIAKDVYRKVDNPRRGAMVSQMATAARNAISQAGRYTLNAFDDALQGMAETITKTKTPREAFAPFLQDLAAFGRRFSPAARKSLNQFLDDYPITKAKLMTAPIHDVTVGSRLSNFLMYLNRKQEFFFRKMAFDARLTSSAQRAGISIANASKQMLDDAVKSALELTFAKAPGPGTIGNAFMKMYDAVPMLTSVHPFPRFWTNAIKFLWDFNPTGFLTAASRARFFSKDPKAVYQALSRATLGSLMLAAANEIRKNPEIGGEKWYEIKLGEDVSGIGKKGRVIDTRAFAPFSTYLFLAEVMQNPERLRGQDFLQGIVSINRIAGTGLVLVDVLRSDSFENSARLLKEFAGNWWGAFSVPFRTISDALGQFIPEEATSRSTREAPLTAPFISAIPGLSRKLPPAPRLTRPEPYMREMPLLRQFTGLTVKTKTPFESEIDRLNVRHLFPRTGDKTLDRLLVEEIGKEFGDLGESLMQTQAYQNASDEERKQMIKDTLSLKKKEIKSGVVLPYMVQMLGKIKNREKQLDKLEELIKKNKLNRYEANELLKHMDLWLKGAELGPR